MNELLLDEEDPRAEKLRWFKVNKKLIWIVTGLAIATVVILLIVFFAVSARHDYDSDPPGTPLPRHCGQRTAQSDWPWTVEVYARDGPGWDHTIALGTLVNDRYVLSSAYELGKHENSDLRVLLGEITFVQSVEDSYFTERVHREIVQKEFYGEINVVLLRMDKAVRFNAKIQPICLPWVRPEIPQRLTMLPDEKDKLFSSSVHLVDNQDCFKLWYMIWYEDVDGTSENHLCAKLSNSSEHCYALRGSPLLGVFHDGGKNRFVQYGIKHYGDCTNGLQIYTNVTHSMDWIREVVSRKDEENK